MNFLTAKNAEDAKTSLTTACRAVVNEGGMDSTAIDF
jgi:hypothetical protein